MNAQPDKNDPSRRRSAAAPGKPESSNDVDPRDRSVSGAGAAPAAPPAAGRSRASRPRAGAAPTLLTSVADPDGEVVMIAGVGDPSLRNTLAPLGHVIAEVESGEQVRAALAAGRDVTLVLLGPRLAGMDVVAATGAIVEVCPHVPVVAIVGTEDEEARAYAAGAADCMPIRADERILRAKVESAVRVARTARRLREAAVALHERSLVLAARNDELERSLRNLGISQAMPGLHHPQGGYDAGDDAALGIDATVPGLPVGVVMRGEMCVHLPAARSSPAAARRLVADALRVWRCGTLIESVELLVSELVTNAVLHARSEVEVAIALSGNEVHVEVRDTSPEPVTPRAAGPDETSGRGLMLVDAMAARWGSRIDDGRKSVWFAVSRPDRHPESIGAGA